PTDKPTDATSEPTDSASETSPGTTAPGQEKSGKISSGAIAGIVVAAVVVAIGTAVGLLFWRRHRQKTQYAQKIDYAEFPDYNPSSTTHNVATNAAPSSSAVATAYQPRYPPVSHDPGLLRDLDEA
ncbi:hypothetical protein LPJ58_006088, partial [Coemansia sp. RSA 1591]